MCYPKAKEKGKKKSDKRGKNKWSMFKKGKGVWGKQFRLATKE